MRDEKKRESQEIKQLKEENGTMKVELKQLKEEMKELKVKQNTPEQVTEMELTPEISGSNTTNILMSPSEFEEYFTKLQEGK